MRQGRLQARLTRDLMRKRALDIEINKEFEELKMIEISVEIGSEQPNFAKPTGTKMQRADQDWAIATHI